MDKTIQDAFAAGLGDAKLLSLSWTEDDFLLDLMLPGSPIRRLRVRFKHVSRLRITLDYGEYAGQPLIFSAEAKQLKEGRWRIEFEFGAAPDGRIDFECNQICKVD